MPHCENTMMASERCVEYKCMCVFLFTGRTQMMSTTFKMKIKWHEKNRWEFSAYSVFNGGWWAISKSKLLVLGGIRWEATEWKITSPLFFFYHFTLVSNDAMGRTVSHFEYSNFSLQVHLLLRPYKCCYILDWAHFLPQIIYEHNILMNGFYFQIVILQISNTLALPSVPKKTSYLRGWITHSLSIKSNDVEINIIMIIE